MESLGAIVIAATVDNRPTTEEFARANQFTFPIAYGLSEVQLEEFDPWWADDHHGHYPQPMEFLILRGGTIFGSLYASGPIGRMDVEEVLTSIRGREHRRLEQE